MSATNDDTFFIRPVDGYAPCIGHLVSMLNYARWSLIPEVERLSQENLDYLLDERANTIGMLLEHIASVEEWYQEEHLELAAAPLSLDAALWAAI